MAEPNYPGNSSLPPEIQQRVAGTFRQSLDLAAKGSLREAQLGCDFVLGLDPEFYPARRLADLLATADGPVDVSELAGEASPVAVAPLRPRFEELVASREFAQLLALAAANRERVAAEPDLQRLVAHAQEKAEAEPYVRPFLDQARAAAAGGRRAEAERALAKARALDPEHPEIARITLLVGATAAEPEEGELLLEDEARAYESPAPAPMASHGPLETGGDARIGDLLREGQAAFDRGEFQEAIDAWSRIFLVDIDHREASRLVDLARQRKAEAERETEELFHEAVLKFEAGEAAEARAGFERVLAAQPGYYAAREYLSLLEEGSLPSAAAPAPTLRPLEVAEAAPAAAHEIYTPPEAPAAAARSRPAGGRRAVATAGRGRAGAGRRLFLLVGGGVLLLLLAGGLWLWQNWEGLFPNSQAPAVAVARAGRVDDPIARARQLHQQGRTAQAVDQLRRLASDSPHFAEAQALASQWESLPRPPAAPASGEQIDPEQLARRQQWLDRAAAELASGERVRALLSLEKAARITALEEAPAAELGALQRELEPLAAELELYRREEWELLLNNLWRRREGSGGGRDAERMMANAYFNLGLRDLQRGEPAAAAGKFEEGLAIDPQDAELQRFARFARTYQERGEDLLFRIFVKYAAQR